MIKRSRNYLLSRMRPDGTFERNARALDTFGRAPEHITDAYIVWALTETGDEEIVNKAIDRLYGMAKDVKDPYFLSLLSQALMNRGRHADAVELLKKVKAKQVEDGGVEGALTSITMSGGRDLKIETTALAVLAWFKANQPGEFTDCTEKAVRWIGTQRGGYGGFGATQSTILALKALIAHTKANKKTPEGGTLALFVNNQKAGETTFLPGTADAVSVELKDPEKVLKTGDNTVRLELTTQRAYPFTLGWSYQSLTPNSAENCAVKLTTALSKTEIREGETVRLVATIENRSAEKGQPMTTAVIGLPAGLKIPEDMKQLKELSALKKTGPNGELSSGDISFFEIRGRELVLYWRDLKPGAKIEINLDLIAAIPGEFRGPASRAYLYYTSDLKQWLNPLTVTIEAQIGE
jgi:alpha-2-macroglobulin-like protein